VNRRVESHSWLFVPTFFSLPFLPAPSQCWVTGKSTLLLASGDQGVGVEGREVYGKNSLEQKAEFSVVYI